MKVILLLLNFILIFSLTSSELFSASAHLKKLFKTEKQVLRSLKHYLSAEEERISKLQKISEIYLHSDFIESKDVDSYLSNPINAFLLIKRLTTDWQQIETLININNAIIIDSIKKVETFPTNEDLTGITVALLTIQKTYKLDTTLSANGIIPLINNQQHIERELTFNSPDFRISMSSNDCFEIGRKAYFMEDYNTAVLWLGEALKRSEKENSSQVNERIDILEYLAFGTYLSGNTRKALMLTQKMLMLSPEHIRGLDNVKYFEELLSKNNSSEKISDERDIGLENENIETALKNIDIESEEHYEALCRGENGLNDRIESKLLCFHLNTSKIPYLRLTHIKVEEISKKVRIVIFHDIISDNEIEVLKSLAEPRLQREKPLNRATGLQMISDYHIAQSAFMSNNDHEVIPRIWRRFTYVTNLNVWADDSFRVSNYGIGGYFKPHVDYYGPDYEFFRIKANSERIATFLIYLSDVDAGGATVFPLLNITIWPKKSSALLWYNIQKSGQPEKRSMHAACPVLSGSRWVGNRFFWS